MAIIILICAAIEPVDQRGVRQRAADGTGEDAEFLDQLFLWARTPVLAEQCTSDPQGSQLLGIMLRGSLARTAMSFLPCSKPTV